MRFRLNDGVDPESHGCGDYAFFHAVLQWREQVVRILAEAEADVNVDRVLDDPELPPLIDTMIHGQKNMVKVLLQLGAQWVDLLKRA